MDILKVGPAAPVCGWPDPAIVIPGTPQQLKQVCAGRKLNLGIVLRTQLYPRDVRDGMVGTHRPRLVARPDKCAAHFAGVWSRFLAMPGMKAHGCLAPFRQLRYDCF